MKTRFLFGCILLFCCLFPTLRAQDTEFWFVAPHMSTMTFNPPFNYPAFLAISNSTFQTAHIKITLYNGGNILTYEPSIQPGGLYKHDFSTATEIQYIENPRGSAGNVVKYGTHIRSDVGVTVYYMVNTYHTREIFTLKGRRALGTLFYVPMQSDNAAKSDSPVGNYEGYDQIDIVATEDYTEVTVEPRARIRIGAGSSPAGTPIVRTLHKGETLKIMEYAQDEDPSLAGTKITSDKPIAVTVEEDMVHGDPSGDQIVPVSSLGTRYIVPKGYRTSQPTDRFYLVATTANTEVKVYDDPNDASKYTPITLSTAGSADKYTFPSSLNAVYVEASNPVYLYQRTGYGEEGASLLPSLYAVSQTQMSFYQVPGTGSGSGPIQKGLLVFRTGTESGFTVQYGTVSPSPLSLTPISIPNVPDWKVARFDYSTPPAGGQVVTVRSTQSTFSLGYITGVTGGNNSFGYFSPFGTFEFPDTTWMCSSSVTLYGGYAMSYKWTLPDGSVITDGPSDIVATQVGEYTLVMNQDPNTIEAKTIVQKVNAGTISPAEQVICPNEIPATPQLTVSGASELTGAQYQWQISHDNATWTNIPSATSPAYTIPAPLSQTTWYRRGMTSDYCELAYTYAAKVRVSSCMLPVNPHLMIRYQ